MARTTLWLGFAAAALALGCGGPPRARPGTLRGRPPAARGGPSCAALDPSRPIERVCAIARLDAEAGEVEVRLRVEPGALPPVRRDVSLRFRASTFGDDYTERFIDVPGRAGWPESLGAVRTATELHYRVSLDSLGRGGRGRAGASWRRPGGWHLTGRSFLPDVWVDGAPVDVPALLVLDPDGAPLFTSAGPEQRQLEAASLIRLADEAYEVGPMELTRREVDGTVLWLGSTAEGGDLEAAADVLARALALLQGALGEPSTESILVTLHPGALDEPDWGERLGSSLVHVSPGGLPQDALYGLTVSIHELVHLWLPGSHHVPDAWLAEGVTDYVAVRIAATLTGASPEGVARVVLRAYAAYQAGAQDRTLRHPHPTDARWIYDAGLVAGYCLDARLAADGGSLFAALRETLARDDETIDTEALLEELGPVAPDAASYLAALVEARGAFDVETCLSRDGLSAEEVALDAWTDRTLAVEVLGARGLSAMSKVQAFVVEAVVEGSPLAPGDVVTAVEGHPVATLDDVAYALRDARVGETIAIHLRRRGEPREIARLIPPLTDDARAPRAYLRLTPREGP